MNATTPEPKQRRGCMFYVGIFAIILVLLILGGVAVGYLTVRKALNAWTDTQPAQLPKVEMTQAEAAQVQKKVAAFKDSVAGGSAAQPLMLSSRDLNGLISMSPELSQIRDKLYVNIENGLARAQISIPLNNIRFLGGRYLNGTGTIKTSLDQGNLRVCLDRIEVNGKQIPETIMSGIRNVNFAQKLNEDPQISGLLKKLASIQVKDGNVAVMPKTGQP